MQARVLHIHHPVVVDARSSVEASLGLQIEQQAGISHLDHQGRVRGGGMGTQHSQNGCDQVMHHRRMACALGDQLQPLFRHRLTQPMELLHREASRMLPGCGTGPQPFSFWLRIWLASLGSALPPVFFISWPTKKPCSLFLPPRNASTSSG